MSFAPINLANLPPPAVVQAWAFDAIVSARLTDFTETINSVSTNTVTSSDHVYTIGPYTELHLPLS